MKKTCINIILISIIILLVSCKEKINSNNKLVIEKTNERKEKKNNNILKWYKQVNLNCNEQETPKRCVAKNFQIVFSFEQEPNIIKMINQENTSQYQLKNYFEGIGYNPLLFELEKERIILVELIFEYSSKFLVFYLHDELYFVNSFNQDDLVDDNGNLVEFKPKIYIKNNIMHIKLGNEKKFSEHTFDLKNEKKLLSN